MSFVTAQPQTDCMFSLPVFCHISCSSHPEGSCCCGDQAPPPQRPPEAQPTEMHHPSAAAAAAAAMENRDK